MSDALTTTIEGVNLRLSEVLRDMQGSLRGECCFGGADVRMLRALLTEMEPIIARSAELRRTRPELASHLDQYKAQLVELQKTTETIRVTLLVQKTSVETCRGQANAASQWCEAFRHTR